MFLPFFPPALRLAPRFAFPVFCHIACMYVRKKTGKPKTAKTSQGINKATDWLMRQFKFQEKTFSYELVAGRVNLFLVNAVCNSKALLL
jgi:hypothetical protein